MRARHRHFNPRFAGAGLVLDSRYINQSDNTAVSSWADRSGNSRNADQATAANQPTFQTAECGGNGIVRFDGSNDQLTLTSNLASVDTAIYTALEAQAPPVIYYIIGGFNVGYYTSWTGNSGIGVFDGSVARDATFGSANIRTVFGVVTTSRSNIFVNSIEATYRTANTPSEITISMIGRRGDGNFFFFNGDICNVSLYTSSLSSSLRRRLEHAAAYSFKIACS